MGEYAKVSSFRLGAAVLRELSELMDAFAPAFDSQARMLTFVIGVAHALFVRGNSAEILAAAQRLLCLRRVLPSEESAMASPSSEVAGSVSVSKNGHRPRVLQIKSTATRLGLSQVAVVAEMAAYRTSFQANRLRIFAGAQSC